MIELTSEEEFPRATLEAVRLTLVHASEGVYEVQTQSGKMKAKVRVLGSGDTITSACLATLVGGGGRHTPKFKAIVLLAAALSEDEDAVLSAAEDLLEAAAEDDDEEDDDEDGEDEDDDEVEMHRVE